MFSTVKYKGYNGQVPNLDLKGDNLKMLRHMIKLCNEAWELDESPGAKALMALGVITIRSGYRKERYSLLEALLYKMPPILFSNSKWFLKNLGGYLANPHNNPIRYLYGRVYHYYKVTKKIELESVLNNNVE